MGTDYFYYPVMHCYVKQFKKLQFLGNRVFTVGMYANADIFVHIPVEKEDYAADMTAFARLIIESSYDSHKIPERVQAGQKVFSNLKLNLAYAKEKCNGDSAIITKSGFDPNRIAEKHEKPGQANIKKIIQGKGYGTYQVLLVHEKAQQEEQVTPKPHDDTIKYYLETAPSLVNPVKWTLKDGGLTINDIIFTDVVPQVQIFVRVYGKNAAGKGQPSDPVPFTPQ